MSGLYIPIVYQRQMLPDWAVLLLCGVTVLACFTLALVYAP